MKNKLASEIFIYTITDLLSKALPFFLLPLVLSSLTPEEFGLATNFNTISQVFGVIISLHLVVYISAVFYEMNIENLRTVFTSTLIIYFGLFILLAALIGLLSDFIYQLSYLNLRYQFLALISMFLSSISTILTTYFRLIRAPIKFSCFTLANVILSALITYSLIAIFDFRVEGRILSIAVPQIVFGILAVLLLLKNKLISVELSRAELHKQLKFGLPMMPHTLSFWVKTGLDKMLITSVIGLSANGIFSIGATLGSIFFLLNNAFNNAYVPHLYKRLTDRETDISRKLIIVKELYLYIFLYFVALIIGYFLIRLGINNYFPNYRDSIEYVPYFLFFNLLNAIYQVFVNFIFFTKQTKWIGVITLSCAIFQGFLAYFLVREIGLHGVGISMVVTALLLSTVIFFYSNNVYKMPWLLKI